MKKLAVCILLVCCLCLGACGSAAVPPLKDVIEDSESFPQQYAGISKEVILKKWGAPENDEADRSLWCRDGKFVEVIWQDGAVLSVTRSSTLRATIVEINGDTALIEPAEGQWERSSGDRIIFNIGWLSAEDVAKAAVGTSLVIEYNGLLMQTYPAKIGEPYSAFVE